MNPTPSEVYAGLRLDFYSFVHRCFLYLNPHTEFLPNWHIELMAAKLEACRLGKIRRLIINVPPRHLKSLCASIALPAFVLGHNPAASIICVSYAQDLADKMARDCRSIMTSGWYKKTFATRPSTQKRAVQEFVTSKQGYRLATSTGGVLTGRGADLIIIDDPLKPEEALSQAQRRAVNDWYRNTLYSRLNDKQRGGIVLIGQRLHEDDLVGHVLGQEHWELVSLPAIAEKDEEYKIETPCGSSLFTRKAGDVLHPERESRATLEQIRQTLGEYHYAGQYQQAPAPAGGGLIKAEWFRTYTPNELPETFDQIIQSWDTANKVTELSDFSACTTWGVLERRAHLLHVLRKRLNYPDLKRAVVEQARLHRATVVLIEDRASGTQLIQDLIAEGESVQGCAPEHDKVMRLHAQTAMIENGFVLLPKEAPWLAEYLHELTVFPNGKYDDQADSTSQALAWISQAASQTGIIEFYRFEMARQRYEEGTPLAEAAALIGVTVERLRAWLDRRRRNPLLERVERMRRALED